jgi:hypothetical protein
LKEIHLRKDSSLVLITRPSQRETPEYRYFLIIRKGVSNARIDTLSAHEGTMQTGRLYVLDQDIRQ